MADNKVSATMDQVTLDKIIEHLKQAKALIPAHVMLTPQERKGGIKMGDGNLPFVLKTLDSAEQHSEIVPGFVDLAEFKKDVAYDAALMSVETHVTELSNMISDTRMVVGGEAMFAALSIYAYVKQSVKQNISSAKAVYDELKTRFMFKKHDNVTPQV